ncbi:hypothetical protein PG985_008544 [Apiospora marii]|uniref:Uncharacterized protein n=1 Tax=Apiospora marii TaxID=335849 RepID=A0ABR1R327_9PEZI
MPRLRVRSDGGLGRSLWATRPEWPKAALISLVNNSDIVAMMHTVSQVEAHFNSKKLHRYDWVFFSNEDFTEEFKAAVLNVSSSRCFFERIPEYHLGPKELERAIRR